MRTYAEIKLKAEDTYRWTYALVRVMIFMDIFLLFNVKPQKYLSARLKNGDLCLDASKKKCRILCSRRSRVLTFQFFAVPIKKATEAKYKSLTCDSMA